jgi:ComF family protein
MANPLIVVAAGWWEAALSFLYDDVCQACGRQRATAREGYVCPRCQATVKYIRPPFCRRCGAVYEGSITTEFQCGNCKDVELHFTYARAAVPARDVVLDVIHKYKYSQALWVEPFLARLLVAVATPVIQAEGWDFIMPIPLHPRREAEREFNQAERLGKALSHACGIPLVSQCVVRTADTRTQTRLSRKERAENVRRAFAFKGRAEAVKGRRIVLVDDVLTTGATANAVARVLQRHGAAEVCAWTLARGLLQ